MSLHGDPSRSYPYFSGSQAETGQGEGVGFTLNLPLPAGCDDEACVIPFLQRIVVTHSSGTRRRFGKL